MEDRRYTSEDVSNTPPAITEDVYEQVDQLCGPYGMKSSSRDQEFTNENTYAAVDYENNNEAIDDQVSPPPPINDEEYEDIDQAMQARKTTKSSASKRSAEFVLADLGEYYEDMNASTNECRRQVQQHRKKNVQKPGYVGERSLVEQERSDYQSLQVDITQSEYKELHNYGNFGRPDDL